MLVDSRLEYIYIYIYILLIININLWKCSPDLKISFIYLKLIVFLFKIIYNKIIPIVIETIITNIKNDMMIMAFI